MTDHLAGRQTVVEALRRELVGPAPAGPPVDLTPPTVFEDKTSSYGPYHDGTSGEEVLGWARPLKRYGVGVLFPHTRRDHDHSVPAGADDELDVPNAGEEPLTDEALADLRRIGDRGGADDGVETLDLMSANSRRPSTIGLTFLVTPEAETLELEATGGRYVMQKVEVTGADDPRRIYRRVPWRVAANLRGAALPGTVGTHRLDLDTAEGTGNLEVSLEVTVRPAIPEGSLVTAVLVNRSRRGGTDDESALFQVGLTVRTAQGDGTAVDAIGPYPSPPLDALDDEERSLTLLYDDAVVFGVGHNCAADWDAPAGSRRTGCLRAEPLPVVEVPSTTPTIVRPDGTELSVPMAPLAGFAGEVDGRDSLAELVDAYDEWIQARYDDIEGITEGLRPTARAHLAECERVRDRMREGLELLRSDRTVRRAFELANRAVLMQQRRSELRSRGVERVSTSGRVEFVSAAEPIDDLRPGERGSWRPFQIAFILASLASTAGGTHPDRDRVELIFFPTGGGKTEAYLGLAAFSIALRRLRDPGDVGVDVLMRYTLRLLTAQQFLRAARLVCALENLRSSFPKEMGRHPITIGIWLGSATTPNSRKAAIAALRRLRQDPANADDPFLLNRCPWCAAEMGPVRAGKVRPSAVVGYEERSGTVVLHCPDDTCAFQEGLPVRVIDEDLYADRPSIVIGTVDKFAMLAWRDDARSLFGLGSDGTRRYSPPNLVIQDELHLISGPLGSMVGLYEMAIEELCTDRRQGAVRPKLVTSTATIRGYEHQVRALFGRDRVSLFPPHGLRADDSFFARAARDDDGELLPGRMYLGVHAGNHSSMIETQVATMAALLQTAEDLPPPQRDPWWTQLVFFNTLRELGTSLSLAQSSVPMQLHAIAQREGRERSAERRISHVIELTSRLRNDEVPRAIDHLERRVGDERPVDICLASNIIEVGIDIDRLSLMVVVGQPKTTSQYIQVTGRVGRRWWERPGLVVTILSPNRSRDRSHFEHFRSYHDRLYAQVEPTSVTPFSPRAVDRALHGALVAYLRQRVDLSSVLGPDQVPDALIDEFVELVERRVAFVDPQEASRVRERLEKRREELRTFGRDRWQRGFTGEEGLLVPLGEDLSHVPEQFVWETPRSMRSVDAECELKVSRAYAVDHLGNREAHRG